VTIGAPLRVSTRAGNMEGYLALALMVVGYAWPYLRPTVPGRVELAIWISLWAFSLLFAVSGVRHGRGGGRAAAGVALAAWSFNAFAIAMFLLH
jgi:hypothetical protein